MISVCGSFKAGDAVPAWLIDFEPLEADAKPADLRFRIDCHIVEVLGGYFLVPETFSRFESAIHATGGNNLRMFAPSKPFAIPLQWKALGKDA